MVVGGEGQAQTDVEWLWGAGANGVVIQGILRVRRSLEGTD